MSATLSAKLDFYRTNEPSSFELALTGVDTPIFGFQLIADITSDTAFELLDQDSNTSDIQLSIPNAPKLNFIANTVTPTDSGYRLVLSAITKNPTQKFEVPDTFVIGKAIFSQENPGTITIKVDENRSKIAYSSSESESLALSQKLVTGQSVGEKLQPLSGKTFTAPPAKESSQSNQPPSLPQSETENSLTKTEETTQHKESILASTKLSHLDIQWRDFLLGSIFTTAVFLTFGVIYLVLKSLTTPKPNKSFSEFRNKL